MKLLSPIYTLCTKKLARPKRNTEMKHDHHVWLRGFFPRMPDAFVYQFGARLLSLYPTTIILYQANKNCHKSSQTVHCTVYIYIKPCCYFCCCYGGATQTIQIFRGNSSMHHICREKAERIVCLIFPITKSFKL